MLWEKLVSFDPINPIDDHRVGASRSGLMVVGFNPKFDSMNFNFSSPWISAIRFSASCRHDWVCSRCKSAITYWGPWSILTKHEITVSMLGFFYFIVFQVYSDTMIDRVWVWFGQCFLFSGTLKLQCSSNNIIFGLGHLIVNLYIFPWFQLWADRPKTTYPFR